MKYILNTNITCFVFFFRISKITCPINLLRHTDCKLLKLQLHQKYIKVKRKRAFENHTEQKKIENQLFSVNYR